MRRLFLALVLACALALPATSNAGTGMYITPKLLLTVQNTGTVEKNGGLGGFGIDDYSQFTFGGAIAAGYDFWPQNMIPIRAEIEFAFRGNSECGWSGPNGSADWTFNTTTLLANFYYDFHNSTDFTPYVGAGLGVAFNYLGVDVNTDKYAGSVDDWTTTFAWNVGCGVAYAFDEHIALDVAYRYLDLGYSELSAYGKSIGVRPYNHEFSVGVRIGF